MNSTARTKLILLMAAACVCFPGAAYSFYSGKGQRLTVTHSFLGYNNTITGSSPSSSYLTPGTKYMDDISLFWEKNDGLIAQQAKDVQEDMLSTKKDVYTFEEIEGRREMARMRQDKKTEEIKAPGAQWEVALDGRITDDPRMEPQTLNLKRFYTKVIYRKHTAIAGDYLANFSMYALNTSLVGLKYTYNFSELADFTVLAGVSKPRWDDLWEVRNDETTDRKFYGARVSKRFQNEAYIGFSGVLNDDSFSKNSTYGTEQRQILGGVDWGLPSFWNMRFYGESAVIRNRQHLADIDGNYQYVYKNTYGHTAQMDAQWGKFSSQNQFRYDEPDFVPAGGAAMPDTVQFDTRNRISMQTFWKLVANFSWYHDNLMHNDGATTTRTRMPELGVAYEAPDWRPDFSAEFKFRYREVDSYPDEAANYNSRTRSFVTGLSDKLGPVNVNGDYELQYEANSVGTTDAVHHILGLGANVLYKTASGWSMSPSARWNMQRDRDNLVAKTDQTNTINAALTLISPWRVDASASYMDMHAMNAQYPGSRTVMTAATLGYAFDKELSNKLEFRARRNDKTFDTPGQDYRESILEVAVTNRF